MEAFSMRGHLLIAPTPVWRRPAPGVGGLPRVPDLIRRPPNCSVENRLNCSVVVFKVLHNSRLRCIRPLPIAEQGWQVGLWQPFAADVCVVVD